MTTKTKLSDSDAKLSMMIERRNLSDGAIKNYNTVFREINELFGVTPSELIRIAKREQKPYVDKETGEYELLDLEDRTVTEYQFKYYSHLKGKNLTNKTIKLKLDTYRALLGEYDIQKPKPIKIVIPTDRIRDEDIVSWKEVETAMSLCKGIRDKAIISFSVTTGLRTSDVRKLTIADLIKACDIYFDENEEKTIEVLLAKNYEEIIPCWEIMPKKTDKKSQLCVTFNTPESNKYIWQYLEERIQYNIRKGRGDVLDPSEPLFATSTKKPLTSTAVEQMFQRINKKMGNKMDKNGKYGRFRSHSLRKLFSTTIRRNITQVVINSDKTSEIDIVSIFTGHVPPNESNARVYEAIESDSHDSYLRKTYTALVPYLSIQEIEVKDLKTQQYKDLEEQNEALKQQLESQAVSMQREMDEQRAQYEKKIRHIESVNSALSTQVTGIQKQIDDMTNESNVRRILDYIADDELVNKHNLADKVIELYRRDFEENKSIIVVNSYIDTLVTRAYNEMYGNKRTESRRVGAEKQKDKDYLKMKRKVKNIKRAYLTSHNLIITEAQEKELDEVLEEYCANLWWKYNYEIDRDYVIGLVKKMAEEGKL